MAKNKNNEASALEKALALSGGRPGPRFAKALLDMGAAPAQLDPLNARFASDLGERLVGLGRLEEIKDLAKRGWGKTLFPTEERWSDPFDAIAARGAAGYDCLEALHGAGVQFFGGRDPDEGPSPLRSAAQRADGAALNYFLEKMAAQKASAARVSMELGRLGAALSKKGARSLAAPLILADPAAWASAVDERGNGPLQTALDNGLLDLADAMLKANPKAVEIVNASRCAFSSTPIKTLDLLVKYRADLNKPSRFGGGALHNAAHAEKRSHGKSLAKKLIALGADPRSTDEHGSTPIGNAMSRWTWQELQDVFGATPKDLMDSTGRSSMQGVGIMPTLILALGQARHGEPAKSGGGADSRMAEIVRAACADSRAQTPAFIEEGMKACADEGLPQCLEAFVEVGAQHGVSLRAQLVSRTVSGLPMGDAQEAGRMECLQLARRLEVDLGQAYPQPGSWAKGKMTTLIEQALDGVVSNSDTGSQYFEPMARKALLLAELGCDPAKAKDEGGTWSFDPKGAGRQALNARTRSAFSAIDAMLEARELRETVGKTSKVNPKALRM